MAMKISYDVENLLPEAKPGDMIEFNRGLYSHWAVYIGNDEIIHRWGENDGIKQPIGSKRNVTTIFGEEFDKAKIEKSKISVVLNYGGTIRVNNYLDSTYEPLVVEIILKRAHDALGQQGYNLIYNNCEHFATDCRYGEANSRQVQVAVGGVTLTVGLIITVIIGAVYSSSRKKKERWNIYK